MGYESMISASMKVVATNVIELRPGGTYNLNENNRVETAVVKLHMLSQFCDMMAEAHSYSGENNVIMGEEVEALAEKLYSEYSHFIEAGCNIFNYDEFYSRMKLDQYQLRPIVNGNMNAGPGETTEGFPEGWWYDFPGIASKHFPFGCIRIDVECGIRIWVYNSEEAVIDGVDINCDADYGLLFVKWPAAAVEIATAAKRVLEIDKDYNNPQI